MEVKEITIHPVKFILKAGNDVNAASTSQTISLQLPGHGGFLLNFMARVKTPFVGVTTPRVSVGDLNNSTLFMPLQDIGLTVGPGPLITGQKSAVKPAQMAETISAGTLTHAALKTEINSVVGSLLNKYFCPRLNIIGEPTLRATFTSSSGNLSSLTAGEIEFVVIYAV